MVEARVISLGRVTDKHPVKRIFPAATRFEAIDYRKKSPADLLKEKLITDAGYESLTNGRKYHHEIGASGAVGLHMSFYELLKSGEGDIVIFEDDCIPHAKMPEAIEMLRTKTDYDIVIFGPLRYDATGARASHYENFHFLKSYFWGMHAIFVPGRSRKALVSLLEPPVDIQVDALISRLAIYKNYSVLIQSGGVPLATQAQHESTVQVDNGRCILCDVLPDDLYKRERWLTLCIVLLVLVLFAVTVRQFFFCSCNDYFYCPKLGRFIKRSRSQRP